MTAQAIATKNRTVVLIENSQLSVETTDTPQCPADGALVKLVVCGLCGSDVEKIKAQKTGATLGHELVGEIIALGNCLPANFSHLKTGLKLAIAHHIPCQTCYFCRSNHPSMCKQFKATNLSPGGFSEIIALTALHLQHTSFVLKAGTIVNHAVLMEPLACCIRAADRLNQTQIHYPNKKSVTIIGLGFIGLLSALALTKRGFDVYGIDINPERIALAKTLGWVIEATTQASELSPVDAVFMTMTTESTFNIATELVKDGGTLLLFAGNTSKPFIDHNQIYHRELTVISSYSPSLLSLQEANDWIQNGLIENIELFSSHFETATLDTIQTGLENYMAGKSLKVLVTQ